MAYFFELPSLMINLDQETLLSWFGLGGTDNSIAEEDYGMIFSGLEIQPSTSVSIGTLKLLVWGLLDKIQDGLTLGDIESVMFFIIFIRFILLAIKYNLKTSLYIVGIGLFASYLWYRHLIDLITMYRNVLAKLPFLHELGMDAIRLRFNARHVVYSDLRFGENVHWYNPGRMIYYAFTRGIIDVDPETKVRYYIDPISMIVSKLNESNHSEVVVLYYKIYNSVIPKVYAFCAKFYKDMSSLVAYAVITRIGKRYCPYLIRWHWTFLLVIGLVEPTLQYFFMRIMYFLSQVLIPIQTQTILAGDINPNADLQIAALNVLLVGIVLAHIGLILFGMFHAIWGQYFYVPFFVENTELHVGPRPKTSIYSAGNTAWQDEKEKNFNRLVPKLWYGWLGKGTEESWKVVTILKKTIKIIFKKLKKKFRK